LAKIYICLVIVCIFYLSLIHVLSNLNFELLNKCVFGDVICQYGFCAGEKKEKEYHSSLPRASHNCNNECIHCHICFLSSTSPSSPAVTIQNYPPPPPSPPPSSPAMLKRAAKNNNRDRGGERFVHGHCHLPSSPLSLPFPLRGGIWGCLAMASNNGNDERPHGGPPHQ
jgi:hypothetical protein